MFGNKGPELPRLRLPTRTVGLGTSFVEEYVIPEEERARVLDFLYPFDPVPRLTDVMYDLHHEAPFEVRQFRVIRGDDMDYLVSPYFFETGGTVVDWMPPDFEPGQTVSRRVRGSEMSIITRSFGPRPRCH